MSSAALPKVALVHQEESGLDSFYMESECQGGEIGWRRGLFTHSECKDAGVSFPSLWPRVPCAQSLCTEWTDSYVGIPRSPPAG